MSDHGLAVLTAWVGALTLIVALLGVFFTYLSVKYVAEQLRIMRQEQRARIASEATLVNTSDGPLWIGGALGRFLKGAAGRLYGR